MNDFIADGIRLTLIGSIPAEFGLVRASIYPTIVYPNEPLIVGELSGAFDPVQDYIKASTDSGSNSTMTRQDAIDAIAPVWTLVSASLEPGYDPDGIWFHYPEFDEGLYVYDWFNGTSLDGIQFKPRRPDSIHTEVTGESHISLEGISFKPRSSG